MHPEECLTRSTACTWRSRARPAGGAERKPWGARQPSRRATHRAPDSDSSAGPGQVPGQGRGEGPQDGCTLMGGLGGREPDSAVLEVGRADRTGPFSRALFPAQRGERSLFKDPAHGVGNFCNRQGNRSSRTLSAERTVHQLESIFRILVGGLRSMAGVVVRVRMSVSCRVGFAQFG